MTPGGYGSSSPHRLIADWKTDDGDTVQLRQRDGVYETVRLSSRGRGLGVVCLPVDRLLARDHREYARKHGRVYGELVA